MLPGSPLTTLPATDGTETLIADTDDKSIDAEINIPKGNGMFHFKGNGDGKMDMKIVGPDQKIYFDKSDIQTSDDTVDVDVTGTFQIVLHLEYHEGSIVIKPL